MAKPEPRKFSLYEYDKELSAAFKGDCEEFLREFEKLQSLSFEDFAKVWQNRKFTYVFAGQSYALVLKQLCENYFYTVKKFIVFPKNIFIQIGALYMLYGLYYKQPLRNWVKIRLTLEEYKKITEVIEMAKSCQHHHPAYIFAKMKVDQAFLYTAFQRPLGPEERFIKTCELYYDDTFNSAQTESAMIKFQDMVQNDQLICELEKTNNEYHESLKRYSAKCPGLVPFASTIVDNIRKKSLEITQGTNQKGAREVKSVKRQIKDKAMASKNAVYRGSRKVKAATDEDLFRKRKDSDSDAT